MHRTNLLLSILLLTACGTDAGSYYDDLMTATCTSSARCTEDLGGVSRAEWIDACVEANLGLMKTGDDAALAWGCGEEACTFHADEAGCMIDAAAGAQCDDAAPLDGCTGAVFTDCDQAALDACLAERSGEGA